ADRCRVVQRGHAAQGRLGETGHLLERQPDVALALAQIRSQADIRLHRRRFLPRAFLDAADFLLRLPARDRARALARGDPPRPGALAWPRRRSTSMIAFPPLGHPRFILVSRTWTRAAPNSVRQAWARSPASASSRWKESFSTRSRTRAKISS